MPNSQLTVRAVRSVREAEALRSNWETWRGHRDSDIDVFLAVCASNKDVLGPCVLVVERDGISESILVARIAQTTVHFKVGYSKLFGVRARVLVTSFGGFRGNTSAEHSQAIMREILNLMRLGEVDTTFLDNIDVDSSLFAAAQSLPGFAFRDHFPEVNRHWIRKLPGSPEALYAEFSGHRRGIIRRDAKKFLAAYSSDINVRCFSEPHEVEAMVLDVEEVAKKGYQRKLGVGFSNTPERFEFFKVHAERGWLRGFVLYAAGKPCAYWIGAIYQHAFTSDFLAFDPAYERYGPGTFLLMKSLEQFCSEGVREVDFGCGDAPYKAHYGQTCRNEARMYVFAPSPRGLMLSVMRTLTGAINGLARKLLKKTNLAIKIKKTWRRLISSDSKKLAPSGSSAQGARP